VRQTFVLTRLDQLRALSDPLRLRLVEALVVRDASVAELAKVVRVPPTRLCHHVDLLLESGLIEVVERVRRGGAEERRFRAVGRTYTLDGSLLALGAADGASQGFLGLARSVLGGALEELQEAFDSGSVEPGEQGRGLVLENRVLLLTPAGYARLAKELPAWLDAFAKRYRSASGAPIRLALGAFPAPPPRAKGD